MQTYKEESVVQDKLVEVVCNCCGGSRELDVMFSENKFQNVIHYFHYGSEFDGEVWAYDLCDECVYNFVQTFKIKAAGFGSGNR